MKFQIKATRNEQRRAACQRFSNTRAARTLIAIFFIAWTMAGYATASNAANRVIKLPDNARAKQQVRQILESHLRNGKFPGAAAAINIPGEKSFVIAVGSSSPDKDGPKLNANQPLNIGSVTKTFVAVVILQLIESGELQLDQNIKQWMPDLPEAENITIRQLLQHTSGLNEYLNSEKVLDDAERPWTPEELIRVAVELGALSKPGEKYQYANTNYIILGVIIEKVTGNPWQNEVRTRISEPLGLKYTALSGEPAAPQMGPGYHFIDGKFIEKTNVWHPSVGGAAGAMIATPADLMKFTLALREGKLLNSNSMAEMKKFITANPYGYVKHDYGLGYERYHVNQLTLEGHMGTGSACIAFIGHDPATQVAVITQINVREPGLSAIIAAELVGKISRQNINPPPMPTASVTYDYFPSSRLVSPPPEVEDLEVQVSSMQVKASYPLSFNNGRTSITNTIEYGELQLSYKNRTPEAGNLINKTYSIKYSMEWLQTFNDTWSMLTIVSPGLASDFRRSIAFEDMTLELAMIGIYAFNDRWDIGLGGGFNPFLGMHYPMPVIAARWNNGRNMKFEAILPMTVSFGYRPHGFIDLGAEANLVGSSYHGDPDKYGVDNPQVRYSVVKAGPTVTLHPLPWLHLKVAGGYTLMRRFEFYDGLDEKSTYDMKNAPYISASLYAGQF